MPRVRVIIWDEINFLQRISEPEDSFLIETIEASGSDDNIIRIGPVSSSAVLLGHDDIYTFVSGVLSGNFITGTFYGDGSQLRGIVAQLNSLTGAFEILPGTDNVTITTDNTVFPTQILISASLTGAIGTDEKVKVTSNDTDSDYLFPKLQPGPNVDIVEVDDGASEKIMLSASATSINGSSGSLSLTPGPNIDLDVSGQEISLSASATSINGLSGNLSIDAGPNVIVASGSDSIALTASVTTVNEFSGSVNIVEGPNIFVNSGSGHIALTASVTTLEGFSGTIDLVAGPNITINSYGPSPQQIGITGSNVFGTEYQVTSSIDIQTNATTTYQEALFLSGAFENTRYYIGWSTEMTNGSNNYDVHLRVLLNGDTANSLNETNTHFRTADTWSAQSAFREIVVPSGSNTISIEFASEFAAKVAKVRRIHIITWRII